MEDIIENLTQAFISQRENPGSGVKVWVTAEGSLWTIVYVSVSLTVELFPFTQIRKFRQRGQIVPYDASPGQGSARALKLPATSAF